MSGLETSNHEHSVLLGRIKEVLGAVDAALTPPEHPSPRFPVPAGQTPLDDDLSHPLMRGFNEGYQARKDGQQGSPYHGHSLEHWAFAVGWLQCDLRMALDKALADARQQR